jgi:hypothetical protein
MTEHCANSSNEKGGQKCSAKAVKGHIFCDPCRIATGGYQRHNPQPRHNATQTATSK